MTQSPDFALVILARRVLLFATLCACCSVNVEAGSRARLSRDLAERLSSGRLETVRVIVSGDDAKVQSLAIRHGGKIAKKLRGGAVLEVSGVALDALSQDPAVDHISGDVPVRRLMSVTTQAIGADQVWQGALAGLEGFNGTGIGVVIIDSGIANHQALGGRVVASVDFTRQNASGDKYGHGTHVAGIIAGAQNTGYTGVAPGAHLVSLKVLNADGSGDTSDVIAAIDWAIEHRAQYQLRVLNLSLGHPVLESYRDDPLCQAVQRAVDAGLVVVAAAGNFGKTEAGQAIVGGIVSPGNSPAALTVGASNTRGTAQRSDDVMATFSSRGPTAIDGLLKPELVAPGNRIVAAAAPGAYLTRTFRERVVSGQGSDSYIEMSGTSMSAAVVSGSVALLLDAQPRLTPAQVKLALQVTSSRMPGAGLIEAGAGNVNVVSALALVTDVHAKELPIMTIAGLPTLSSGITYADDATALPGVAAKLLVWGNALVAIPSSDVQPNLLVWGNILVWGSETADGDILVWGSTADEGDILVWGSKAVWAEHTDEGDILVWGSGTDDDDILVWGSGTDDGDILVWGSGTDDGDILVWGSGTVIPD